MPTSYDNLLEELIRCEQALQKSCVFDVEQVSLLLSEDFFEYGSSGGAIDKKMVMDYLSSEAIDMTSGDFALKMLGDEAALLTYRSIKRFGDAKPPAYANRSSIWMLSSGHWKMVFHQGTPTKPFAFKKTAAG